MALYLIQHGKALSKQEDPNRPITQEGIEEVTHAAHLLAQKDITVDRIIHSGKSRAEDTARIFRHAIDTSIPMVAHDDLNPTDDILPFVEELDSSENLMVVGHLPFLSKLISHLVIGDSSKTIVNVVNGGVVALSNDENGWAIDWIIVPR